MNAILDTTYYGNSVIEVKKNKYPLSNSAKVIADGNSATSTEKLQLFRFNPDKQGTVFPPHHPYYKAKERVANALKDKEAGLTIAYESATGATVKAHDNADPKDFSDNIRSTKILADDGTNILIREHNGLDGKNVELEINGRICDFKGTDKKTTSGANAVRNAFTSAVKQEIDFFVFVMPDKFYSKNEVARKLFGELNLKGSIKDVWMIFEDSKIVKIENGMSYNDIEKLLP